MAELFDRVMEVVDSWGKIRNSIRHLCYRVSSIGVISKTETAFDTLGGHLAKWRKEGRIGFGHFVDATRWHHGSKTFDNAAEAFKIRSPTSVRISGGRNPSMSRCGSKRKPSLQSSYPLPIPGASKPFPVAASRRSPRRGKLPRHSRKPFGAAKSLSSFTSGISI